MAIADMPVLPEKVHAFEDENDGLRRVDARLDRLSARSDLPEGWGSPPIYHPGMEHELRAQAAVSEAAAKLRGIDLEAVARNTNLAEATGRRVMDRLLAEPDNGHGATTGSGWARHPRYDIGWQESSARRGTEAEAFARS